LTQGTYAHQATLSRYNYGLSLAQQITQQTYALKHSSGILKFRDQHVLSYSCFLVRNWILIYTAVSSC